MPEPRGGTGGPYSKRVRVDYPHLLLLAPQIFPLPASLETPQIKMKI